MNDNQETSTEDFGTTLCSVAAPLTFGSLFAGIGGFDLGFERAGMVCKWQVEIDEYANRVLAKHWPNVHRERDIRETGPHNLEYVDVICGGFPCQDISYAGLGAGLDGARSGLFFEAIRLVRELRPQFVVLENVAALLTRGLDRVLGTLAEIGYDAEWHCIPAAAVGAPHIRDRVFVMAHANGGGRKEQSQRDGKQEARQQTQQRNNSMRCSGDVSDANGEGCKGWKNERTTHSQASIEERRQAIKRTARWKAEPNVGRVVNGFPGRVDRVRCLGNAVVPQVAEYIGRCIVAASRNVA